jgi:hypothetical protein
LNPYSPALQHYYKYHQPQGFPLMLYTRVPHAGLVNSCVHAHSLLNYESR